MFFDYCYTTVKLVTLTVPDSRRIYSGWYPELNLMMYHLLQFAYSYEVQHVQIFFFTWSFFFFPFCTLHATFTYFAYFLFFLTSHFPGLWLSDPPPPPPPSPFHPPLFNINRKQCYVIFKISEIPGRPRLYSPLGFSGLSLPSKRYVHSVLI